MVVAELTRESVKYTVENKGNQQKTPGKFKLKQRFNVAHNVGYNLLDVNLILAVRQNVNLNHEA